MDSSASLVPPYMVAGTESVKTFRTSPLYGVLLAIGVD